MPTTGEETLKIMCLLKLRQNSDFQMREVLLRAILALLVLIYFFCIVGCQTQAPSMGPSVEGFVDASSSPSATSTVYLVELSEDRPGFIPESLQLEKLADGFKSLTGPEWIQDGAGGFLLFCDPPSNSILKWRKGRDVIQILETFEKIEADEADLNALDDSSVNASQPNMRGASLGLGWTHLKQHTSGVWYACDPRERALKKVTSWKVGADRVAVARYEKRRLQGPMDLVFHPSGEIFFTDSAIRSPGGNSDPFRELVFNGVYRWSPGAKVPILISGKVAFPDGLALSPDGSILYVSNNDPSRPIWVKFPLNEDLDLDPGSGSVFFDATAWTEAGEAGSPAGLVVHSTGVVVGAGPGGVFFIAQDGKLLGRLPMPETPTHCALDQKENWLYITTTTQLWRVRIGD